MENLISTNAEMTAEERIRELFAQYDVAGCQLTEPVAVELTRYADPVEVTVDRVALWEDRVMLSSECSIFSINDITEPTAMDVAAQIDEDFVEFLLGDECDEDEENE